MDIENIYKQLIDGNKNYFLTLCIEDFYSSTLDFDPVTNESLYTNYDDLLCRVGKHSCKDENWFNDRFQNIVNYCETSIYQIMDFLHEKNLREHRISNPNKVRDVDTTCMMWLSKKPGFNIRQKIASEQKMMGVFHETSIDTSENRLFKTFIIKLDNIFAEKEQLIKILPNKLSKKELDNVERLIGCIHRWKYSDEARSISAWNNVPPNNTLLNDKNYRKIWKAWNFLQYLESDIDNDVNNTRFLISEISFIYILSQLKRDNRFQIQQDVILPNYQVSPKHKLSFFSNGNSCVPIFFVNKGNIKNITVRLDKSNIQIKIDNSFHNFDLSNIEFSSMLEIKSKSDEFIENTFHDFIPKKEVDAEEKEEGKIDFVAIDINKIYPDYIYKNSGEIKTSIRKLLCQTITIDEDFYDIPCAQSKYISVQKEGYKTYSIHHFFNPDLQSSLFDADNLADIDAVSSYFAKTLAEEVKADNCVYLIPDNLDDFSPVTNSLKRAMSSQFSKALLLPRSVAGIFSNYKTIVSRVRDKEEFRFEDLYDSYKICVDYKVLYNENLRKICPESKGYVFQRKNVIKVDNKYEVTHVPDYLKYIFTNNDVVKINNNFSVDNYHFEANKGHNVVTANGLFLNNSRIPDYLSGVSYLYELQKKVNDNNDSGEDISLWKDYLPPLFFVQDDNSTFPLVEEDVSINPFSNKEEIIPISTYFRLPKNKHYYEFPLIQGEGKEKTRYFAYIKDTALPLDKEIVCKLKLTYTYGAPLPYNLEFIPTEPAIFNSLTVSWENKSHKDLLRLPAPLYPNDLGWTQFSNIEEEGGNINYLNDFAPISINEILNKGKLLQVKKVVPLAGKDQPLCILNQNVGCFFQSGIEPGLFDIVWCYPNRKDDGKIGGLYSFNISYEDRFHEREKLTEEQNDYDFSSTTIQKFRLGKLRKVTKTLWNNTRSVDNEDCPDNIRLLANDLITYLIKEFNNESIPKKVLDEYLFLLAIMSNDVPYDFIKPKVDELLEDKVNYCTNCDYFSYLINGAELDWQKNILNEVLVNLENPHNKNSSILVLSRAVWRNPYFINNIPFACIDSLLDGIDKIFSDFIKKPYWEKSRNVSSALELLVGLFRLRNKDDERILKKLSPFYNTKLEKIQNEFPSLFYSLNLKKIKLKSFLQFNFDHSTNKNKYPDILYVADLYIDGKVNSNSIKILNNAYDEGD